MLAMPVHAKIKPPPEVPAIRHGQYEFKWRGFFNRDDTLLSVVVEAWSLPDEKTPVTKPVKIIPLLCKSTDPRLELDAQFEFVTSMKMEDGLLVAVAAGQPYYIDPGTLRVVGPPKPGGR
jgi:hypothetical protein